MAPRVRPNRPQVGPQSRSLLYHYTSADALIGILTTGTLWATQVRFLNDSAEFTFARDALVADLSARAMRLRNERVKEIVSREIRRVAKRHVPAHLISFSERGNTLSQWRAYAPRDGVSIGFYRGGLTRVQNFNLHKCLYLAPGDTATVAQRRAVKKLIADDVLGWMEFASSLIRAERRKRSQPGRDRARAEADHGSMVSMALIFAALRLKHHGFAEEREWRLIDNHDLTSSLPAGGDPLEGTHFRRGPFGVTPYVVATLPARWRNAPLGIAEVIVGPTPDPDATMASIRDLLWATQRSRAAVISCEIPYRSW